MASCGGGGGGACHQPHCQRPEDGGCSEEGTGERDSLSTDTHPLPAPGDEGMERCTKCREEPAVAGPARLLNGMCAVCYRAYLYDKFKLAVTTNAMISPTDKILVSFSGGPASSSAAFISQSMTLQFIHEMQRKSLQRWDASNSQALPVFNVGVAFIDESIIHANSSIGMNRVVEQIRSVVSALSPAHKDLHIAPIENICSLNSNEGRTSFNDLLDLVTDATGKEDLLQYLCLHLLQKIGLDNGYSKLVLGSCTSTLACHVLSATVKAQGYSLPADVQYVDSRWELPVVFPLRDCVTEELKTQCHLDGLEMLQMLKSPSNSINNLIASFVSRLQDENPSRERTIVRTAEKLKPFGFNKFVEDKYHEFLPFSLRCKFENTNAIESSLAEVFCPLCGSPLSESELQSLKNIQEKSQTLVEILTANCCQSCSFQILPKGAVALQNFYAILPQTIKGRVTFDHSRLRELIDDCLLLDDDDDDNYET